jgi:hypothetical protein
VARLVVGSEAPIVEEGLVGRTTIDDLVFTFFNVRLRFVV